MQFKPLPRRKIKTFVKGIFSSTIPFVVREPNAVWQPPFFENQKWGNYDSDDCWCLSSVQCATIQINWLLANNQFGTEALNFFNTNGYIVNGTFQLSELFHEILCGNLDNGGTSPEAWQSFASRGFIPRSMLNYSQALANADSSEEVFIEDYYNVSRVTPAMKALGQQFLKYVTIQSQGISTDIQSMRTALQQAPLNIGIPVDGNQWNQVNVPVNTDTSICHEVSLLSIDSVGNMTINDQYQPNPKFLASGYYVGVATQGFIRPIQPIVVVPPIPQQQRMSNSFYAGVLAFWKQWFGSIQAKKVGV